MLPNWLLGKSKSKLQEILGGGGGGTSYTAGDGIDISNGVISFDPETAPAIDPSKVDGLDDDLAALAAKTQITNPNLLHNPWFQVNQRGFTTTTTNEYCVDRWSTSIATTGQTTYTLNSDGTLTIDNTLGESHCYLVQKRTAKTISRIAGKKVTLSIMLSDGTIHSGTETYSATESVLYYEDDDIRLQSFAQTSGQFFVLRVKAGKSVTIKALKLELGSISTLAMDTAPDMATELLKCQRYYVRFKNSDNGIPLAFGYLFQGNSRVACPLSVPMRTKPSFAFTTSASGGPTFILANGDVATNISDFTIDTDDAHQRIIFLYPNVTSGTSEVAMLRLNGGALLELSAEL